MSVTLTKTQIKEIRVLAKGRKKKMGSVQATIVAFAKVVGKFLPECKIQVVA